MLHLSKSSKFSGYIIKITFFIAEDIKKNDPLQWSEAGGESWEISKLCSRKNFNALLLSNLLLPNAWNTLAYQCPHTRTEPPKPSFESDDKKNLPFEQINTNGFSFKAPDLTAFKCFYRGHKHTSDPGSKPTREIGLLANWPFGNRQNNWHCLEATGIQFSVMVNRSVNPEST